MPERTSYDHGTPSWADLGSSDIDAAKGFYSGLFGWTHQDMPAGDAGTYTMFFNDGKAVAGGYTLGEEQLEMGVPPHWQTVVSVDSVDDAAAAAKAAGGAVMMEPTDVMTAGRMAIISGPTGETFAMWEAGDHHGAQLVNEPGAIIWNELITDDTAAAQKFYADTLGWGAGSMEMPDGSVYTSFTIGEDMIAGMMAKTPEMGPMPNVWGTYFAVGDIDAAVAKVAETGGTVFRPPFDVLNVGRIAVIADPQGAACSIMEPASPA